MRRKSEIEKRWKSETPKFWKKIQKIGITSVAVGTFLATAPIALPTVVITLSGYLIVGGTLTGILSQLTTDK